MKSLILCLILSVIMGCNIDDKCPDSLVVFDKEELNYLCVDKCPTNFIQIDGTNECHVICNNKVCEEYSDVCVKNDDGIEYCENIKRD